MMREVPGVYAVHHVKLIEGDRVYLGVAIESARTTELSETQYASLANNLEQYKQRVPLPQGCEVTLRRVTDSHDPMHGIAYVVWSQPYKKAISTHTENVSLNKGRQLNLAFVKCKMYFRNEGVHTKPCAAEAIGKALIDDACARYGQFSGDEYKRALQIIAQIDQKERSAVESNWRAAIKSERRDAAGNIIGG